MENSFFAELKQELAEYGKALGEVGQLRLIGIISRVLGMFLLIFTLVLCALALFAFIAVALIDVLSSYLPVWASALIVGSIYVVLILLAIACRKPLFIHPFIKLMTKQIRSEEELALKTIEAEHKAELAQVRITGEVENATREFNFVVSLFSRLWDIIKGLRRRK
jgi:hypothetical protein